MSSTCRMFVGIVLRGASFGVCLTSGGERGQSLVFRAILSLSLPTVALCFSVARVTQGVTSSVSPGLAEVLLLALLFLSLVPVFPAPPHPLHSEFLSQPWLLLGLGELV